MLRGCRKCRREGEKLFLKGDRCLGQKCAVTRRPYAPGSAGQKGAAMHSRLSDYGRQLREKQKAKRFYDLSERQFSNYYLAAAKKEGNTSEILWQQLETRLDNLVRRSGVVKSIAEARQLVSHGKVKVNGQKVNVPSRILKVGDKIEILKTGAEKVVKQGLPKWLTLDAKSQALSLQEMPAMDGVESPFDVHLVIEFYSK